MKAFTERLQTVDDRRHARDHCRHPRVHCEYTRDVYRHASSHAVVQVPPTAQQETELAGHQLIWTVSHIILVMSGADIQPDVVQALEIQNDLAPGKRTDAETCTDISNEVGFDKCLAKIALDATAVVLRKGKILPITRKIS